MENDIVKGIAAALRRSFGSAYRVYQDNVEQGLQTPCFFILPLQTALSPLGRDRFLLRSPFDIHFFPEEETQNALMQKTASIMAYKMFLGGLMMPVCPGKVTLKVNSQNKTINLMNGEEINLLKVPGLSDVSFELLLPHRVYPFSAPVVLPIGSYLSAFERLKQRTTGFQWIFVRTKPGGGMLHYTNMTVSLEDYQIIDDAAEGLDTTVRMELKQWRAYGAKQAVVTRSEDGSLTAAITSPRESSSAPSVSTYVTKAGDTLWNIARQMTGSGENWQTIAQRSGLSTNTPEPGTTLELRG